MPKEQTYVAFEAWADTLGYSQDYRDDIRSVWQAAYANKSVTPTITDEQAETILSKMSDHVVTWADSQDTEPTPSACSGTAIRFILNAVEELKCT